MKIMVTGAGGMLGQWVVRRAAERGCQVLAMDHAKLSVTSENEVRSALEELRPNVLINCAGIVRGRDLPKRTYYDVNGLAPRMMYDLCQEFGIFMTQVSTNCVFDGSKPYTETDKPCPIDDYGESKAMGERGDLIIRTSFVGLGQRGLLSWLMQQQGTVPGYRGVKWNGLTVDLVTEALLTMTVIRKTGIFHLYGPDTTKYDLLYSANRVFALGLKIEPVDEPVRDERLSSSENQMHYVTDMEAQLQGFKEATDEYNRVDPCGP